MALVVGLMVIGSGSSGAGSCMRSGLAAHGIKVNAANPGYVATDLNEHRGYRTVEQGATIAVHLATLGPLGPTAGFFNDGSEANVGRHAW